MVVGKRGIQNMYVKRKIPRLIAGIIMISFVISIVPTPVSNICFAKKKVKIINLKKGETYKIKVKSGSKIKCSNKKIVKVTKKGKIIALKKGKCIVRVKRNKTCKKYRIVVKEKVMPTPALTAVPTTEPVNDTAQATETPRPKPAGPIGEKDLKIEKIEIKDDKNSVVWLTFEDKENSYYGVDSTARENGVKYYKLDFESAKLENEKMEIGDKVYLFFYPPKVKTEIVDDYCIFSGSDIFLHKY